MQIITNGTEPLIVTVNLIKPLPLTTGKSIKHLRSGSTGKKINRLYGRFKSDEIESLYLTIELYSKQLAKIKPLVSMVIAVL